MSPATKQQALEKLHAVANKIGYPDKWRDYSALTIARDDVLGNVLRAREFEFNRQIAQDRQAGGSRRMGHDAAHRERLLQSADQRHQFPGGHPAAAAVSIPKSDDAPNYGDTGATIGHELTHGFDDEGRQFDAQGNLRDWWTPEDGKQFDQRASCISDQYSQYVVVDDIKINGKLTLGENVADLGGLMLAYMAWKSETQGQKLEPIDGFTPEQRFFIGYGQSWCSNTRDETKRMWATIDPALTRQIPRQWRSFEHAGISAGFPVQGRFRRWCGRRDAESGEKRTSDLSRGPRSSGQFEPECASDAGRFTDLRGRVKVRTHELSRSEV